MAHVTVHEPTGAVIHPGHGFICGEMWHICIWFQRVLHHNLVYGTFLESRYWLIVKALLLKARRDRCEVCGSPGPLEVHHLTYAHRGAEIWHLDDLQLLCSLCHRHRHDAVEAVEPEEEA